MRKLGNGVPILYVNEFGVVHDALVTQDWSYGKEFELKPGCTPSLNLVFVSKDDDKTDTYGSQIERATSVVHRSVQQAHGRYWTFADEK